MFLSLSQNLLGTFLTQDRCLAFIIFRVGVAVAVDGKERSFFLSRNRLLFRVINNTNDNSRRRESWFTRTLYRLRNLPRIWRHHEVLRFNDRMWFQLEKRENRLKHLFGCFIHRSSVDKCLRKMNYNETT